MDGLSPESPSVVLQPLQLKALVYLSVNGTARPRARSNQVHSTNSYWSKIHSLSPCAT